MNAGNMAADCSRAAHELVSKVLAPFWALISQLSRWICVQPRLLHQAYFLQELGLEVLPLFFLRGHVNLPYSNRARHWVPVASFDPCSSHQPNHGPSTGRNVPQQRPVALQAVGQIYNLAGLIGPIAAIGFVSTVHRNVPRGVFLNRIGIGPPQRLDFGGAHLAHCFRGRG